MTAVRYYEVGGFVRDSLLGHPSKDVDYSVEADSYEALRTDLVTRGFDIFVEHPEFLTIRARFPRSDERFTQLDEKGRPMTADFVLARADGAYTDGRRPDEVIHGTLFDDLARRDFTVNAIARDADTGEIIDPWRGQEDLRDGLLRCVGSAYHRISEDPLRALRALRFAITKDMLLDGSILDVLWSDWLPEMVANPQLSNRKREELRRAFAHDTVGTVGLLARLPQPLQEAIFSDGLWLEPTHARP